MIRITLIVGLMFIVSVFGVVSDALAINYSAGSYGTCTYDTCSISLTSGSTTTVNVTPTGSSATCTVQSNTVTATTDASTGYLITINNSDTVTALSGPSANTIPSVSGTAASPVALTANTWGYRVDGIAGFGAGPTGTVSNGAIPSGLFAATPSSVAAGATIRSTSSADSGTVSTPVWFGVCANSTKPSGAYTDNVTFTATVN